MPQSPKNHKKGHLEEKPEESWAQWTASNVNLVAEQASAAAAAMQQTAEQYVIGRALEKMPESMVNFLLYCILSDNLEAHTKTFNDYAQAARQSYQGFIAKFSSSPVFQTIVEGAIARMFPPVFLLELSTMAVGKFHSVVSMSDENKIFIVQCLLPKMSSQNQRAYVDMLAAKQPSELRSKLVAATRELEFFNKLSPKEQGLLKLPEEEAPKNPRNASSWLSPLKMFSRSRSSSSLNSESPKNKNPS